MGDYGVLIEDGEDAGVALRGLFIISPEGKLRQITVNDLPVGRSVDEVLRLVTAFQYTDEHGEVCPANWKPGAKTMIDDPEVPGVLLDSLLGRSRGAERRASGGRPVTRRGAQIPSTPSITRILIFYRGISSLASSPG